MDIDQLLKSHHVALGVKARDWRDVLEKLASLFTSEEVANNFADRLIAREEQYPTGLSVKPFGVALPHADPGVVKKSSLGILTLSDPVYFREMANPDNEVPVRLVIGIAITESEKEHHVGVLSWIVQRIQDEDWLERIVKAGSKEEVLNLFSV